LTVAVRGRLIVDDLDLVIRAALDGVGLAYLGEYRAARHLDSGALGRAPEPWCLPFPGSSCTTKVDDSWLLRCPR
jgi:DNA-binding transcriptional LysR family regulator